MLHSPAKVLPLCLALLLPAQAQADGSVFHVAEATVDAQATQQRALMWLRDGTWEIHIQPIFARDNVDAAWVVPFPVLPVVRESSAELLDQLEVATAQAFAELCYHYCCSGDCDSSSGSTESVSQAGSLVQVWGQGSVSGLDYVILSSPEGEDIVQWLINEGYALSAEEEAALAEFEAEGQFFFVGRLGGLWDPALPLPPVRFLLQGLDPPSYPLRLTGLAVPEGAALDLTLWVVFPYRDAQTYYHVASHPEWPLEWPDWQAQSADAEAYRQALEEHLSAFPEDVVVQVGQADSSFLYCEYSTAFLHPIFYSEMGVDCPDWVQEMGDMGGEWIYRYQARLDAAGLSRDLALEPTGEVIFRLIRIELCRTCRIPSGSRKLEFRLMDE